MNGQKDLETSSKALDQIMKYLNKGPVLGLIGLLIASHITAIVFLVRVLVDSRDREGRIKDDQIKFSQELLDKALENRLKPIERKVDERVIRLDSTISGLDSLSNKLK